MGYYESFNHDEQGISIQSNTSLVLWVGWVDTVDMVFRGGEGGSRLKWVVLTL